MAEIDIKFIDFYQVMVSEDYQISDWSKKSILSDMNKYLTKIEHIDIYEDYETCSPEATLIIETELDRLDKLSFLLDHPNPNHRFKASLYLYYGWSSPLYYRYLIAMKIRKISVTKNKKLLIEFVYDIQIP